MLRNLIAFAVLSLIKIASHLFYPLRQNWINPKNLNPWSDVRMIALLNHTSLFEPLYVQALPFSFLWKLSSRMSAPGANKTLDRPIVGRFWKLMAPGMTSITRKRDDTWNQFLDSVKDDSIVLIAPEGRMKRPNGLDAYGKPMHIKPGIADIFEKIDSGIVLLAYSGGLHHVQAPGERLPRIFKPIALNVEVLDVQEYKKSFQLEKRELKLAILKDLEERMRKHVPQV